MQPLTLLEFKAYDETQTGRKIKSIQTDNGTEYRNNKFDFLKINEIKHRLTVTHTPEQNGVAERRNRTLMDMAWCLLFQSELSSSFWGKAINTANYIRNRCPSNSGRTPFEKWIGKIPSVKHFQKFGCEIYTLDRNPNKKKFDSRSKRGIFVGYSEQSKAYRVWIPDDREIDITRDVKFIKRSKINGRNNDYEDFMDDNSNTPESSEITFPLGSTEDNDTPDDLPNPDSEDKYPVDTNEGSKKRGQGRPRKILPGLRGRPKKYYHNAQYTNDVTKTANMAEVPLEEAVQGSDADQWFQAIT